MIANYTNDKIKKLQQQCLKCSFHTQGNNISVTVFCTCSFCSVTMMFELDAMNDTKGDLQKRKRRLGKHFIVVHSIRGHSLFLKLVGKPATKPNNVLC